MKRRTFITNISLFGGALFGPVQLLGASLPHFTEGIFPFKVGKFKCYSILDGIWPYASLELLFHGAPTAVLNQKAKEFNLTPTNIKVSLHFLLIDTGEELLLVDTGAGDMAKEQGDQAGRLRHKLMEMGIDPNDIKKVVISHQHFDHFGGVCNENGEIRYPNATFYMDRKEYESLKEASGWEAQRLKSIEEKLETTQDGQEISKGIKVLKAYGHTPGHIHLMIRSDGEEMLYVGDTFGHELHFEYPDWAMSHEYSKENAVQVRKETLNRAVKENLILFSCHLPFPGIGKVKRKGESFKWIPTSSNKG